MKVKFKAHNTFFVRMGWLYKGLSKIAVDTQEKEFSDIFICKDNMNKLGLGSNMVKSLRYWMGATGLTEEKVSGTNKGQKLTTFGDLVYKNDPHFESLITLLLCHYFIAANKELCTSWYYFFNEFNNKEFTKEDLLYSISQWISGLNLSVAESSFESDIECIVKTYLPEEEELIEGNFFEDNKKSPFTVLNLINRLDGNTFCKTSLKLKEIPSNFAMYVICKQIEEMNLSQSSLNFENLVSKPLCISKILNLSLEELISLISRLEVEGYLKFIKTAGLEQIIIDKKKLNSDFYLTKCYERINNEK